MEWTRQEDRVRPRQIANALPEWLAALGTARVLGEEEATRRYGPDTTPNAPRIPAALLPETMEQVITLVKIARRHAAPLYPISTGRNWGYGSAQPTTASCAIVDLSRLRRIIAMDEELGLVTVEPGVTQGDLRAYLEERGLPFLVPVTGAGPDCSLIGNVLERGYGITPVTDHFLAMTSIEAVLPDGDLYRSPMAELGAWDADRAFKWGVGPYLDGLFSQGNFAIVTRMTLALARRPERMQSFFFWIEEDSQLEEAVGLVRELLRTAGANIGGINLMSAERVLAMSAPYPHDRVTPGQAMSAELLRELSGQFQVAPWMGAGSMYGSREHIAATRALIKRVLRPHVQRLLFVDGARVSRAHRVLQRLPGRLASRLALTAGKMLGGLDLMAGKPSEVALPLAYWKARVKPGPGPLNPARDGCGLLWYSPIVPMRPERARAYVELARRTCRKHGLDAPITFTSLSERAFDSTLPLLFASRDAEEAARAQACYEELFSAGLAEGFVPYRVGVSLLSRLVDARRPFWRMVGNLKESLDPAGIIAPGRYAPIPPPHPALHEEDTPPEAVHPA